MSANLTDDCNLTHAITNYLQASYRGKFAALNCLKQLSSKAFQQEEISRTEKTLETVQRWIKDLWQNMPLLSASWHSPETFEAKRALDLLNDMKRDLKNVVEHLNKINSRKDPYADYEDVKYVISAFTRFAYGRDNFLKGFMDYGKIFNRPDMLETYSQYLGGAAEDIHTANTLMREFKQNGNPSQDFYVRLANAVGLLPNILRMNIHDLNHLAAAFEPEFTFDLAEISRVEGQQWQQLGMNALAAGYWQAYDMNPEETVKWLNVGFTEASIAGRWHFYKFAPEEAITWENAGIYPELALRWQQFGYSPDKASVYIQQGIDDPETVGPVTN